MTTIRSWVATILLTTTAACTPGDTTELGAGDSTGDAGDASSSRGLPDATDDETGGGSLGDSGDHPNPCADALTPPALLLHGPAFRRTGPRAAWAAPAASCGEVADYEVAVGTEPGADDLMAFTSTAGALHWDGMLAEDVVLPAETELYVSVRAIVDADATSGSIAKPFATWSPRELAGLALWVDFADGDTVFSDLACTTPAGDEATIVCVHDKSGNANHVAATAGLPGPILRAGALAGLGAADFTGERALQAADAPSLSPSADQLTVAIFDAPGSLDSSDGDPVRYLLQKERAYEFAYIDGSLHAALETAGEGIWQWASPGIPTTANPQLNLFTYDHTWQFRRNGEPLGAVQPAEDQLGPLTPSPAPLVLGARFDSSYSVDYDGLQAEIVVVTEALPEDDRRNLERYLLDKWMP